MAIEPEAILQRLEEIEAELGDSSIDHYPVPNTITQGQLRRLCQGTRELLARLHKLEKMAEAARVATEQAQLQFDWEDLVGMGEFSDALEKLHQALAALEEVNDESRDPQAA